MTEIATCPRQKDWVACIAGFPMLASIGATIPALIIGYLYMDSPAGRPPLAATLAAFTFGAILALWFVWRTIGRQYWWLSESELITGLCRTVRLPLANIDKIVVGLPTEQPSSTSAKVLPPAIHQAFENRNASSLVLIFQNGLLLPLNLYLTPNGPELMAELASRFKNRLVANDDYTPDEIRLLRHADLNALIQR